MAKKNKRSRSGAIRMYYTLDSTQWEERLKQDDTRYIVPENRLIGIRFPPGTEGLKVFIYMEKKNEEKEEEIEKMQ